ncbi:TetR family transcriptional regulator [Virgibacillus phasianinus]|uniref:TetR family transcriptional regulator n=1 Tax=Virgibacillus phasianinus TaxID=2017483 RepID=A0A220U1B7_9BACI|nr:TetR family transcriptional regulator [Virgibacillus phasianinus]ASK61938.1 TetR family transcriptional regulator [Virgibacillus phasianinus]
MRVKKQEKYDAILEAAFHIIEEKGFENTSISDIVKRANVAQGTFYLYFKSKNDLVPAIAEELLTITNDMLTDYVRDSMSIDEKLKKMIDVTFENTKKYKAIIALCYSGQAYGHSFGKWEEMYTPYYNWMEKHLLQAKEQNEIAQDTKIEFSVRIIINTIEQTADRMYLTNSITGVDSHEDLKKELFNFIKRALV